MTPEGWDYLGRQMPGRRNPNSFTVYCFGKDLARQGTLKFFYCPEHEMSKEHLNLLASKFNEQGDQ